VKEKNNPLLGCWRIIEADLRDQSHPDLLGPAKLMVRDDARGEITFVAMPASLSIAYGADNIDFIGRGSDGRGSDEGDKVQDTGHAELLDGGFLQTDFEYQGGDEATLKTIRPTSSASC
jgi:hypothetical protein